MEVTEEKYTSVVELKIGRSKGTYGEVQLNFVVSLEVLSSYVGLVGGEMGGCWVDGWREGWVLG